MPTTPTALDTVFENLTKWRGQPGYQLERRLDVLLSPYLAGFVESRFRKGGKVTLITSEFPIPKSLISGAGGGKKERAHVSADFLLLRGPPTPAWILLEFKTDMGSRTDREDGNYSAAVGKTMGELLLHLDAAKASTPFERDYRRQASPVRVHARRYPDAKLEVHFLQPTRGPKDLPNTHTLSEFIHSEVGEGDALWTHLTKLLRGVVRSDKARRSAGTGKKRRAASPRPKTS